MAIKLNTSSPKPHIFMPTQQQLKTTYAGIVANAIKSKTIVALKHAPAGAAKLTGLDINKPGTRGVSREVFTIRGELYLRSEVVAPNAQAKWFKVGPQPEF